MLWCECPDTGYALFSSGTAADYARSAAVSCYETASFVNVNVGKMLFVSIIMQDMYYLCITNHN